MHSMVAMGAAAGSSTFSSRMVVDWAKSVWQKKKISADAQAIQEVLISAIQRIVVPAVACRRGFVWGSIQIKSKQLANTVKQYASV
jgi:hypothetical protein